MPPMIPEEERFTVMVAANNTSASRTALDHAIKLCGALRVKCKLYVVYFIALNPKQTLPYIDHLEKAYNMEIQSNAETDVEEGKKYLAEHTVGKHFSYEFVQVEGEGETGPLIEEYIRENHTDLDLFIVGTRNLGGLQKWALGSVSDYCLHHLECPVTVVKDVVKS
ncbi:hypothetical protein DFS34DRAFT_620193 [Phlyctochytrium arcticum]|nr:hypothetical protein DFS34DRAFT_620193 [Phlyctochytrium arcticum]